jgi:hypothetical protein
MVTDHKSREGWNIQYGYACSKSQESQDQQVKLASIRESRVRSGLGPCILVEEAPPKDPGTLAPSDSLHRFNCTADASPSSDLVRLI